MKTKTMSSWACRVIPAVALVLSTAVPMTSVFGASPSSGSVDQSTTPSWAGATGMVPTASAGCGGANNPACDNYALTIVPPASGSYLVTIALQPLGGDDWDVEVYAPDGTTVLGSSGNSPGALEVVTLADPPAGIYTVAASPFAAPTGYSATATLDLSDALPPGGAEQVEFYVYADPALHNGGEPSGGVNWQSEPASGLGADNGGSIMFVSSLTTLRVSPNDCTAPATYLSDGAWQDISVPFHAISLDPIGVVDETTGRMFSDQLAVKSSLLGLSDDNGNTWTASQGAPVNPGVDHQTLGVGRLAEPLYSQLDGNNPLYNGFAHGVYYASQDIALAQAGLSVDGGQSFGAAVPMYTLVECSGLHGHLKVSPVDGSVYVPNKSCSGAQAVVLSEDNGNTWEVRPVPDSGSGEWDPSVGIATDGTVYVGLERGGVPMVSVSDDKGQTWSALIDVSNGTIKTVAFPQMISGDADRAAFAFLGTTTPGSLGTDQNNNAEWHMYVSMTFDHGLTWTTTNVTDNDPVQRGVVCDQGTTCESNRNLLDFNDIQVDKRGRPVVFFADGCVDDCVTNPGIKTQAARATIARLKSPKGLFEAYDADRLGQPDWPQTTAAIDGADVLVSWIEPGDGGNAIEFYEIRKNGVVLTTVSPSLRNYTDVGAAGGSATYEVLAHNSAGYSRLKTSCDNGVIPGVLGPDDPWGPCDFLGQRVLKDKAGDILTSGNPLASDIGALDVRRLGLSESDQWGPGNIAFVLSVEDTDTLPPDAIWPIQFKDAAGSDRFVRMDTQTGAPVFSYGLGTDISPVTNPGTPADPQSFADNGNIVIVVPRVAVGATITQNLNTFLIRVRLSAGVVTITPDNMPDTLTGEGSYDLVGSENCPLNNSPVALDDLSETTTACHPLVIDVLANDSDPDGDSLTITGASAATNGIVVVITDVDGQKLEYRPNTGFAGTDTFTYTVDDGNGESATATVLVTVMGSADSDGDGLMDFCDNCIDVANNGGDGNPAQCDTNGDGFGNACDGDLNNNGVVNFVDLGMFKQAIFTSPGDDDWNEDADLTCNDVVNFVDLGLLKERFLDAPGPSGLVD